MPPAQLGTQPRIPAQAVLGRVLEDYILQQQAKDADAASQLTPRLIRNFLIKHFQLGNEHALDVRKQFIKETARAVVERYNAGEPRLYPVAPPRSSASPSKASTSTPPASKQSQRKQHVNDDDDDEDEEPAASSVGEVSRPSQRTPTKAELQRRKKATALAPPSDEDEEPDDDVQEAAGSPDSISDDDDADDFQPARKSKGKATKRKSSKRSPSPSPSASPPPSPPRKTTKKAAARTKEKQRAKQVTPESDKDGESSDSMLAYSDSDIKTKKRRTSKGAKATKTGRGGKRASTSAAKTKTDRLTSLKKLCVACGARKVWSTYFKSQGCPGDPESDEKIERAQIDVVSALLESVGGWEGMPATKAAKIKEDRALAKELEEIGAFGNKDSGDEGSSGGSGVGWHEHGSGRGRGGRQVILDGKRTRKPSAMAMASAEYEGLVSQAKSQLNRGKKRRVDTDGEEDDDEDAPAGGDDAIRAIREEDDLDSDDEASSAFEMSDDDDEDVGGGSRSRGRGGKGRRPHSQKGGDDFIVDDEEELGYERKKKKYKKAAASPPGRGSRRIVDSDDDDNDSSSGGGGDADEQADSDEDGAPADGEVSLHLSTQIDSSRHQDKGEIPRRKKRAEDFRDDLKSFANALNS